MPDFNLFDGIFCTCDDQLGIRRCLKFPSVILAQIFTRLHFEQLQVEVPGKVFVRERPEPLAGAAAQDYWRNEDRHFKVII